MRIIGRHSDDERTEKASSAKFGIDRLSILATIADLLRTRNQWLEQLQPDYDYLSLKAREPRGIKSGCLTSALEYQLMAESLVELLETDNCGSVGGFDKGQPDAYSVDDRFDWLSRGYEFLAISNGKVRYREVAKPPRGSIRRARSLPARS